MVVDMKFRIKELCKERGILFKDLARTLGMTDVALRQSINGNPTVNSLERIANALGVTVQELFELPDPYRFRCPRCGAVLEVREAERNLLTK